MLFPLLGMRRWLEVHGDEDRLTGWRRAIWMGVEADRTSEIRLEKVADRALKYA